MLSDERLAEIRARCEAATPGPWELHSGLIFGNDIGGSRLQKSVFPVAQVRGWGHLQYREDGEARQDANAELLAHARQDIPDLLDEIARLKRQIAEHVCTLPASISEALNMGDGSYKP